MKSFIIYGLIIVCIVLSAGCHLEKNNSDEAEVDQFEMGKLWLEQLLIQSDYNHILSQYHYAEELLQIGIWIY